MKSRLHPRIRHANRLRPELSALEGRTLMASLVVTSAADSGPGSLRQVVAGSASGDAVTFAPSLRGSTIKLTSGPIAIGHSLSITGLGSDATTIDGGGKQGLFAVAAPKAGASDPAIAVSIVNVTLTKAVAANYAGGAINAVHADLTLIGDVVTGNTASGEAGGAVFIVANTNGSDPAPTGTTGSLTVRASAFVGNRSPGGAALTVGLSVPATITGSTFAGNTTTGAGAAILNRGSLTVQADQFLDNATTGVGGIGQGGAIYNGAKTIVADSYFRGNQSAGQFAGGGAIFNGFGSSLTMTNSYLINNSTSGSGGAISGDTNVTLNVSTSSFLTNRAASQSTASGGAISTNATTLSSTTTTASTTIVNTNFLNNQAVGLAAPAAGIGGALSASGPLTISGGVFLANTAQGGSGGPTGSGFGIGGAVHAEFGPVTVAGSVFNGNSARAGAVSITGPAPFAFGGGLDILSPSRAVAISNSIFLGNTAAGGDNTAAGGTAGGGTGGGIAVDGGPAPIILNNVLLIGNAAVGGADNSAGNTGTGGTGSGGGLSVNDDPTTINGGQILGNTATGGSSTAGTGGIGRGGGIYYDKLSTPPSGPDPGLSLVLNGALLAGNTARGGAGAIGGGGQGGGIWTSQASTISGSTVVANAARGGPSSKANTAAGQGLGGGFYRTATAPVPTIGTTTTIAGNTATTAGNDTYPAP